MLFAISINISRDISSARVFSVKLFCCNIYPQSVHKGVVRYYRRRFSRCDVWNCGQSYMPRSSRLASVGNGVVCRDIVPAVARLYFRQCLLFKLCHCFCHTAGVLPVIGSWQNGPDCAACNFARMVARGIFCSGVGRSRSFGDPAPFSPGKVGLVVNLFVVRRVYACDDIPRYAWPSYR